MRPVQEYARCCSSASLEQLSSLTKRNSESARKASELAQREHAAAELGVDHMRGMSTAIEAICVSSDEIAFQTNVLALNAAEELQSQGETMAGPVKGLLRLVGARREGNIAGHGQERTDLELTSPRTRGACLSRYPR